MSVLRILLLMSPTAAMIWNSLPHAHTQRQPMISCTSRQLLAEFLYSDVCRRNSITLRRKLMASSLALLHLLRLRLASGRVWLSESSAGDSARSLSKGLKQSLSSTSTPEAQKEQDTYLPKGRAFGALSRHFVLAPQRTQGDPGVLNLEQRLMSACVRRFDGSAASFYLGLLSIDSKQRNDG